MKFKTTKYHFDLIKDSDRLAVFLESIKDYDGKTDVAYDLGCGSGILSYFLSSFFDEIIAVEIDNSAFKCAEENLADFENIEVINENALSHDFKRGIDLIVCEMMDTALIDEEEVPVLNHAKKFLSEDGVIIPKGVINTCELVNMEREYIHWDEEAKYEVFSDDVVYSKFDFLDDINPNFEATISIEAKKDGIVNGLKITTHTLLNDNLICGPTPMFNPPLLIPIDKQLVKSNQFITVKLKYIMGNGIESIETEII